MYKTVNIGIFTTIESWDFKNKRPKKRINFFFFLENKLFVGKE